MDAFGRDYNSLRGSYNLRIILRFSRSAVRALIALLFLSCFLVPVCCAAQSTTQSIPGASASQPSDPQFGEKRQQSPDEIKMERDMARQRNKERQKQLQADTDKLLKLATELKQYVDKTNENILSMDVLKKTDEIGKLAKSVHDKMKAGGYDAGPQ